MEEVVLLGLKLVAFLVASGLSALLGYGLFKLAQYLSIEVDEKKKAIIVAKIRDLILMVEERYISDDEFKAKALANAEQLYGKASSGAAKLAAVVTEAVDRIPGISKKEAEDIVYSIIPTLYEEGVGGVFKKVLKAMENDDGEE